MMSVNLTSKSSKMIAGPCQWFVLFGLLVILSAGCSRGTGLGSMAALIPGSGGVSAGQSEPDVDYEAEAAAQKQSGSSDE